MPWETRSYTLASARDGSIVPQGEGDRIWGAGFGRVAGVLDLWLGTLVQNSKVLIKLYPKWDKNK